MPRIRLTKSAIDALPTPQSDVVYWDVGFPGFGVKVTPKGRKVFVVLYRTGGAGSKLRKYTIGPYGRVTPHQARVAAQKVVAAKLEGRDPAAEKREAKRRVVADRVEDLLESFIAQRLSQNRSAAEVSRILRREIGKAWTGKSIHEITKRDVVCRCIDTGMLAFGGATPMQYLMPPGVVSDSQAKLNDESVLREILKHHDPSNLVMITHDLNISNIVLEPTIKMGEFFVLQPNGADFDVIGKIRMGDE